MVSDDFTRDAVTIHVGQRLTMFNNSNIIHVIGPGRDGHVWGTERNVPVVGFHLFDPVCRACPAEVQHQPRTGNGCHQVLLRGVVRECGETGADRFGQVRVHLRTPG
jgi:hypothetical protein